MELDFREEYLQCPICNHGEIDYKTIDSEIENQLLETYYYSCGHFVKFCELRDNLKIHAILQKIRVKSSKKIENKPTFEIEQKFQLNDRDNPDKKVWQIFYTTRNSNKVTIIFQIVMYESGDIKHIHCKFCNTEWTYRNNFGFEDLFVYKLDKKTHIECLYCHSKIER